MEIKNLEKKMSSYDENIATIRFEILDLHPFKSMLDILKGFRDIFTLRFWPTYIEIFVKGLSPSGKGDDEKSKHRYIIYGDKILNYQYPIKEVDGRKFPIHPHISIDVKASEIVSLTKGQNRNDTFDASIKIDLNNSSCKGMFINPAATSRSLSAVKVIEVYSCHLGPPPEIIDYYEKFYASRNDLSFPDRIDVVGMPNSRVSTAAFSKCLVEMKAANCTRFDLSLTDDRHIDFSCYRGSSFVIGGTLPESGLDISINQNSNPRAIIDLGDGFSVVDDEVYIVSLNVRQVEWLGAIEKLAKMSILEIYMERGYPLVLRTNLGLYGHATFILDN